MTYEELARFACERFSAASGIAIRVADQSTLQPGDWCFHMGAERSCVAHKNSDGRLLFSGFVEPPSRPAGEAEVGWLCRMLPILVEHIEILERKGVQLNPANPIAFLVSTNGMGVPYTRPASDPNSRSYIDLKVDPHRIDELPELDAWPELRDFVYALNQPESCFETFGCEKCLSDSGQTEPSRKLVSFVSIGFEDINANLFAGPFFELFVDFRLFCKARGIAPFLCSWELESTGYHDFNAAGWSVRLFVGALANSDEDVRTEWGLHLQQLRLFFEEKSAARLIQ